MDMKLLFTKYFSFIRISVKLFVATFIFFKFKLFVDIIAALFLFFLGTAYGFLLSKNMQIEVKE